MSEVSSAAAETIEVGGHTVALTNLDRVLFPATGFTKRDLVAYALAVAPVLVPHLRGRPLSLGRFPDGVDGRGFLQNTCRGSPPWLRTLELRLATGTLRRYCLIDDAASLAWVANLSTIELHPYPVDAAAPDRPVQLVLDLDPGPGAGLRECAAVALRLADELRDRGLDPAVKTSGATGLHLAAAVAEGTTFADTRALARGLAERLASQRPAAVTADARPAQRAGRVLVDWQQNAARRSTIAPYSLRAADRPGVSAPLLWDEVAALAAGAPPSSVDLDPLQVLERAGRHGDLYAAALRGAARR